MRALFFSMNNNWAPHFETELELMAQHQEQCDQVFVLACSGKIKRCVSNPHNLKTVCMQCKSRFNVGMEKLGIAQENIFYLKKTESRVHEYPLFSSYDELKNFKMFDISFGLFIFSSLVSELGDTGFDLMKHKQKIYDYLDTAVTVYHAMQDVVKKIHPDSVYIFNGRFVELATARAVCKQQNIDYYIHERGGTKERYSLFKNSSPHVLETMKSKIESTWQEADANDRVVRGKQWFVDRVNRLEQEWIVFCKDQEAKKLPESFDENKKNIAIFNSSIHEYAAFDEWNNPLYVDDNQALCQIMVSFQGREDIHFYLRVHPHLKGAKNAQMKDLHALANKGYKHLTIIWPEEDVDSYALMNSCATTITLGSTIGVEANFWGKPSILVGKAFYEDLGCCYIPKSHDELIAMIDAELLPMAHDGAIKYGFWAATNGILFKRFKPEGLFGGAFLGEKIKPKLSTPEKLLFRVYAKFDTIKLKRLQNSSKS